MNPLYARVAQRASHRCEYCQAPEALFNFPFEVEHIVPTRLGGTDEDSNLALSCRSCNLYESDYVEAMDPQSLNMVHLFHPRRQSWQEHFTVDGSSGSVVGLTASGRATVERLQMNRQVQLAARKQWMRLKLYPPS